MKFIFRTILVAGLLSGIAFSGRAAQKSMRDVMAGDDAKFTLVELIDYGSWKGSHFLLPRLSKDSKAQIMQKDFTIPQSAMDGLSEDAKGMLRKQVQAIQQWVSDVQQETGKTIAPTENDDGKNNYELLLVEELKAAESGPEEWDGIKGLYGAPWESEALKLKLGPIRIRKTLDDWDGDLDDVDGATLSFEQNELDDSKTWSSEGALIYPVSRSLATSFGSYRSARLTVLPSVTWKLSDVSSSTNDVEDLAFQLPISLHGRHPMSGNTFWVDDFLLSPYYHTDFHFDADVVGAELTYSPYIKISRFAVGGWTGLFGKTAYLLRVAPKINASEVLRTSRFLDRPNDDTRISLGARLEAGLRPFGEDNPWELKATYTFGYDVAGTDKYSDLFEAKTTYWFVKKVGLTFSFQKGETPVSDKNLNLLKLGLEVKL
jgi:hypothetical protein